MPANAAVRHTASPPPPSGMELTNLSKGIGRTTMNPLEAMGEQLAAAGVEPTASTQVVGAGGAPRTAKKGQDDDPDCNWCYVPNESFCGKYICCKTTPCPKRCYVCLVFWAFVFVMWLIWGAITLGISGGIVSAEYKRNPRLLNKTFFAPTMSPNAPSQAPTRLPDRSPTYGPTRTYSDVLLHFKIGAREFSIPNDVQFWFVRVVLCIWIVPWAAFWVLAFILATIVAAVACVMEVTDKTGTGQCVSGDSPDAITCVTLLAFFVGGSLLWPVPALCVCSPLIIGIGMCVLTFCFQVNV